jgi:hypothetical protein
MISASQLSSARKCPRKWAYKSIAKVPYEPGAAAKFGIEGHAQAERWLATGEPPDQLTAAGRLATEGIPFLPRPGEALVEVDFSGATGRGRPNPVIYDGIPFVGYIDALAVVDGHPLVIDHKFTRSPQYALTVEPACTCGGAPHDEHCQPRELLRENEQGIMYPFFAARLLGERDRVSSRWIYYPRNKQRVFTVDDCVGVDELTETMHSRIIPLARLLHGIRQRAPSRSVEWVGSAVPCDPKACDWVGKFCDYADLCQFRNDMSEASLQDLQAKLQAAQAQLSAGASPNALQEAAVNPPATVAPQPQAAAPQFQPPQQAAAPQFQPPQQAAAPQFQPPQQAAPQFQPPQQVAPPPAAPAAPAPTAPAQPAAEDLQSLLDKLNAKAASSGLRVSVTFTGRDR